MPDFSTYIPPSVLVEEQATPLISTTSVAPTIAAIVGPSVGYRTHSQPVTLSGVVDVQLAKLGINTSTIVVRSVDGAIFALTTDYVIVVGAGADADLTKTQDNTTTIARAASSTIPDNATVYVTYQYTDAAYFTPQRFGDFDDVKEVYGEPLNLSTGVVTSPLSLAAKVYFENGGNQVVLLATTPPPELSRPAGVVGPFVTRTELTSAYAKLLAVADVNIVVGLPIGIQGTAALPGDAPLAGNDLRLHVEAASLVGDFRIGLIGYDQSVTVAPQDLASGMASKRMVLAWPNRMSYYNGQTSQIFDASGAYLASAYAGGLSSRRPQDPLTRKPVRGFAGIPDVVAATMTTSQKNVWSSRGVAVTERTRDGRLVIRHGTTTKVDNLHNRELSLVRAKDSMVALVQATVDGADLIGTPIYEETITRVKGVVAGSLETAVGSGLIVDYNDLKARQTSIDPSVIEVKFQFRPAYPLNYIVIVFSINISTGEISAEDAAALAAA